MGVPGTGKLGVVLFQRFLFGMPRRLGHSLRKRPGGDVSSLYNGRTIQLEQKAAKADVVDPGPNPDPAQSPTERYVNNRIPNDSHIQPSALSHRRPRHSIPAEL